MAFLCQPVMYRIDQVFGTQSAQGSGKNVAQQSNLTPRNGSKTTSTFIKKNTWLQRLAANAPIGGSMQNDSLVHTVAAAARKDNGNAGAPPHEAPVLRLAMIKHASGEVEALGRLAARPLIPGCQLYKGGEAKLQSKHPLIPENTFFLQSDMGDWGVSTPAFAELHWRGNAKVYILLPTDMAEPPWLRDAGFSKVCT